MATITCPQCGGTCDKVEMNGKEIWICGTDFNHRVDAVWYKADTENAAARTAASVVDQAFATAAISTHGALTTGTHGL